VHLPDDAIDDGEGARWPGEQARQEPAQLGVEYPQLRAILLGADVRSSAPIRAGACAGSRAMPRNSPAISEKRVWMSASLSATWQATS